MSDNAAKYYRAYTYTAKDSDAIKEAYAKLDEKQIKINANIAAQDGIPEGNDTIPAGSQTENDIFNAFGNVEKTILGWMEGGKNQCEMEIKQDCYVDKIESISKDNIKRELDTVKRDILNQNITDANTVAREFVETSKDLRSFRQRHERDMAARYPEIFLKPWAILIFLFFAETLINGFVFKDLSGGIFGGIGYAAFFALINILIAMLTAKFGWKYLIYKDRNEKVQTILRNLLGFFVTIVGMITGFFWNLGVAHFREVATSNSFETSGGFLDTGAVAWQHFINDPFKLGQLEAYALWVFGIIVFIFVARDFYNGFDDPYPDYGKITRKQKKAEEKWLHLKSTIEEHLMNELDNITDNTYSEDNQANGFSALIQEDKKKVNNAKEKYNNLLAFKRDSINSLEDSKNVGNKKLGLFREEYTKIVGEDGRRKHFEIFVNYSDDFEYIFNTSEIEHLANETEENYLYNQTLYKDAILFANEYKIKCLEELHDKDSGFFEKLIKANNRHISDDYNKKEN